jgi:hypothetical protein
MKRAVGSVLGACLRSLLLTSALLTLGVAAEASRPRAVGAADQTSETVFLTNTGTVKVITSGCRSCAETRPGAEPRIGAGEGYVEFIASEPGTQWLGGLTRGHQNNAQDIAFAIYFTGAGVVEVRENGVSRATVAQRGGDVFRIALSSHPVRYTKNNVVFYTSARIASDLLRFTPAPLPQGSSATDPVTATSAPPSSPLDRRGPWASRDRSVPVPAVPSGVAEKRGTFPGPDARLTRPNLLDDFADANPGAVDVNAIGTGTGGVFGPVGTGTGGVFGPAGTGTGGVSLVPGPVSLPSSDAPLPAGIAGGRGAGGSSQTLATTQLVGVGQDGVLMRSSSFSEASLRDLLIDVTWNLPGGGHSQRLELFSPDGALYQRFTAPLGSGAPQTIETRLPVGGTWMTQYSLFGRWSVAVYLDDDTSPATSTGFFLIQ